MHIGYHVLLRAVRGGRRPARNVSQNASAVYAETMSFSPYAVRPQRTRSLGESEESCGRGSACSQNSSAECVAICLCRVQCHLPLQSVLLCDAAECVAICLCCALPRTHASPSLQALAMSPPPQTTTPEPDPDESAMRELYGPESVCSWSCVTGAVFGTLLGVGLCLCGALYLYTQ